MARKLGIWSNLVQIVHTYSPQEYFDMHCLQPPYMAFLELLCTGDHFIQTQKNWVKEICQIASNYPEVEVAVLLGFNHADEDHWQHAEELLDELEGLPSVKYCGVMGEYIRDDQNNSTLTPASLLRAHNQALSYGWIPMSYYISNKINDADIPAGHMQIGHTNWPCGNPPGSMEVEAANWHTDPAKYVGQSNGLWEFHQFPGPEPLPPIGDHIRGNWHWSRDSIARAVKHFAENGEDVRHLCAFASGFNSPTNTAGQGESFIGVSGKTTIHLSDHPEFRQILVEEVAKYPGAFTPAIDVDEAGPKPVPPTYEKRIGVQMNEYAGYSGATAATWFPVMMSKIGPKSFYWNTVWTSTTRPDRNVRLQTITQDIVNTLTQAKQNGVEYILRFGNAGDAALGLGQQLQDEVAMVLDDVHAATGEQVDWIVLGTEWCQIEEAEYGDIISNLEKFSKIAEDRGAQFGIYQVVGHPWLNESTVPGIREWVVGRHSNYPHTDSPPLSNSTPKIWEIDNDPNVWFHASGYDAAGVPDEWYNDMLVPSDPQDASVPQTYMRPLRRLFEHAEGRWTDGYGTAKNFGPIENLKTLFVLFIKRDDDMLANDAFCNEFVAMANEYGYDRFGGEPSMPISYQPSDSPHITVSVSEPIEFRNSVLSTDETSLGGVAPYTAIISGQLTDGVDGDPIEGRTLTLQVNGVNSQSAVTDVDGDYMFSQLFSGAGTYDCLVRFAGDQP